MSIPLKLFVIASICLVLFESAHMFPHGSAMVTSPRPTKIVSTRSSTVVREITVASGVTECDTEASTASSSRTAARLFIKPFPEASVKDQDGTSTDQPVQALDSGAFETADMPLARPCGMAAPLNSETWKKWQGTAWLADELTKFRIQAQNNLSKNFVTDYMLPNYFPDAAPSQLQCNMMEQCSIGTCQNLRQDLDDRTKLLSWFAIESIANFNNYLAVVHEAVQDAATSISVQLEPLVNEFSSANADANAVAKVERTQKIIMAAALGITLVSAGAIPGFFSVRAGSEAFNAAMNAIPGTIAGAQAGGNSLAGSFFSGDHQTWVHNAEVGLAKFFARSLEDFERGLKGPSYDILRGWNDTYGKDLVSILGPGHFAMAPEVSPVQLTALLTEYWQGVSINHLWTESRAYIIMSKTSNCTADSRGPHWTKVCLDEAPDKVFYAYYLSKGWELNHIVDEVAQPLAPPGFNLLKPRPGFNITLKKAVHSSYKYYLSFKHQRIDRLDLWALGFGENDTLNQDIWNLGAAYKGIFTIPICRDDFGRFISSVSVNEARNYPCICGPSDGADKNTWSFDNDESAHFFDATGLRYSADVPTYCEFNMGCVTDDRSGHKHKLSDKYGHDKKTAHMWKTTELWRKLTRFKLDWAYTQCPNWNAHSTMGH